MRHSHPHRTSTHHGRHAVGSGSAWAAYRTTFEDAAVGAALLDASRRFVMVNAALCRLTGRTRQQLLATTLDALIHPDDREAEHRQRERLRAGEIASSVLEVRYVRADGRAVWVLETIARARTDGAGACELILHAIDVTESHRHVRELEGLAEHDALTGLYNRRRFDGELRRAVARAARYGDVGALLMADVDHFKAVNDTRGHLRGDDLLRRVARVLADRVRETDVLARIGGDEFALILPGADATQAMTVAADLARAVRDERVSADDGAPLHATLSIGIALYAPRPSATADDLLRRADTAMYEAKVAGRDRIAVDDDGFASR